MKTAHNLIARIVLIECNSAQQRSSTEKAQIFMLNIWHNSGRYIYFGGLPNGKHPWPQQNWAKLRSRPRSRSSSSRVIMSFYHDIEYEIIIRNFASEMPLISANKWYLGPQLQILSPLSTRRDARSTPLRLLLTTQNMPYTNWQPGSTSGWPPPPPPLLNYVH